jgi:hypothetical protein
MLPAARLHHKMKFDTGEVGNELLSSESMVCKAAIAK